MKVFWTRVIFLLLILPLSNVSNAKVIIKNTRPRLLIDQSDIKRIRKAIRTYSKKDFNAFYKYAADLRKYLSVRKITQKTSPNLYVRSVAFVGLILNDSDFIKKVIEYAVTLAKAPPSLSNDTVQRNRLISMSYVYDWLYDYLTPEQKSIIRKGIIAYIDYLKYFLDKPLYTGGHSRYGSAAIMAGLIALYGDYGDWHGDKLLERVKRNWEKGYNPFQSYVAKEGGYHMGWKYGAAYTDPLPYVLWEKATGERWCEDWRNNQVFWYIYGLRGDKTLPRSGDCYDTSLSDEAIAFILTVASAVFKNQYAEWFYQNYKYYLELWDPVRIYRIIFRDPYVKPKSPASLPLSRCFKHSGFVVARDAWDETTTQLIFKCTPFYTLNHHHKDQNHIELSYKGSLLIDSGSYEPPGYGSSHWKNYYTRTIAHNTMVVFDPEEEFILNGEKLSNDGGQKFPDYNQEPKGNEPKNLAEVKTKKYRIGGIIEYSSGDDYCWARGDATGAYHTSKVKSYIRDVLMVNRPLGRKHPCILLLDRVELNKKLTPKILFHFNKRPEINNNYFSVRNTNGGYLHGEILLPLSFQLNLVGGKRKRWWVNGVNYIVKKPDQDVDPGWGRLEVGIKGRANKAIFLTLLSVDDIQSFKGRPNSSLVLGDGYCGALFGENLLLINYSQRSQTEWAFSGREYNRVHRIYLAGITPNQEYILKINDKIFKAISHTGVIIINIPKRLE